MNFSEAVKNAMDKNGMRRSDLARATEYSYQYIYDLLAGKRRWHEVAINKVCEALDIKIEITCEGDEEHQETAKDGDQ